ncbi:MAG: hypothetical protein ACR2HR_01325 [Euzebya sp.]
MRGSTRRTITTGGAAWLALLVLVVAGSGWPGPAQAADGACSDSEGVTVVVDFQSLGGPTLIRCAAAPVSSGFDALTRAGIAYQTVTPSPGFICRIEGLPADQTCADFAPADAYWSYWTAQRGGAWSYSSAGAGNRVPPPGTVEGWSFSTNPQASDTQPPRTPPPDPPQPPPSDPEPSNPEPSTPEAIAPQPPASAAPGQSSAGQPPPPADPGPASAPQPTPRPGTPPQSAVTPPPAVATIPPPAADDTVAALPSPAAQSAVSPAAPRPPSSLATAAAPTPGERTPAALQVADRDSSPPTSTLVGSGLVLSIVAGAGVVAWRRRNEDV